MDDGVLAPVDFLAVEFRSGRVAGDALRILHGLAQRSTVRVLDLEFIAKAADGSVTNVRLADVDHAASVDVRMWEGLSSGLLDRSDVDAVAAAIAPGSLAGILVYENQWVVPLLEAIERDDGAVVGSGRVTVDDLLTALDEPAGTTGTSGPTWD